MTSTSASQLSLLLIEQAAEHYAVTLLLMITWSVMVLCVRSSGARVDIHAACSPVNGIEFLFGRTTMECERVVGRHRNGSVFADAMLEYRVFPDEALGCSDRNLVPLSNSKIEPPFVQKSDTPVFCFPS
jgi:hypothetical protein